MASRKRNESRQTDPRRLRTYSFLATFAVIIMILGASYYQTLPTVEHMPDTVIFTPQEWMPYVPANAEYVGYINYKQAYFVSGNSSLFGESALLELPQLGFSLIPLDLTYEVGIQLPQTRYSGSATLLQVSVPKQTMLSQDLTSANLTKVHPPVTYDGFAVYGLLIREIGDKTPSLGFLAVVNHYIVLSNDQKTGFQNVQAILDQISTSGRSLFDDTTVRRSVYATGVTDQNYVALFVGRFATQLNNTVMATKSIIGSGGAIQVSRALLFPSSDIALQRWDQAHKVYRNADRYRILDSWLVVTYNYPPTKLQTEIQGI